MLKLTIRIQLCLVPSGPINHFKSADLKNSCIFWVEMEVESGRMAGPGSTDVQDHKWASLFRIRMKRAYDGPWILLRTSV